MDVSGRDSSGRFAPTVRVENEGRAIAGDISVRLGNWKRVNQHASRVTQSYARHLRKIDLSHMDIDVDILVDKAHLGYERLADITDDVADVVLMHARKVLLDSLALVPVDTHRLKSSGKVNRIYVGPKDVMATITYDTEYAIFVHEMLELKHKAPTQAKFLEQPLRASQDELVREIRKLIRRIAARS